MRASQVNMSDSSMGPAVMPSVIGEERRDLYSCCRRRAAVEALIFEGDESDMVEGTVGDRESFVKMECAALFCRTRGVQFECMWNRWDNDRQSGRLAPNGVTS